MKYLILLFALAATGCVSAHDLLSQANIEHSYEIWLDDKRPTISDEEWLKLSEEERKGYITVTAHKLRENFFNNASYYESSKGKTDE